MEFQPDRQDGITVAYNVHNHRSYNNTLTMTSATIWTSRRARAALIAGTVLIVLSGAQAGVVNARSVSFADVNTAVSSAANADTVVIPAGTASWTATLTISKPITLQGAGGGSTIIQDNLPSNGADKLPATLIHCTATTGLTRITGITLTRGTPNVIFSNGLVDMACFNFRIDHCTFYHLRGRAIYVHTDQGVIDHNTFNWIDGGGITFHGSNWGGIYGDVSWSQPLNLGTANHSVYVEDNTFANDDNSHVHAVTDGYAGSRFVFRHNVVINDFLDCHGTESTQRYRGTRSWEIYQNTFSINPPGHPYLYNIDSVTDARSGTGVIWGNTATGPYGQFSKLANYRDTDNFTPWGGSDGSSGFDLNANGGAPYLTGTHAGANGATTLLVLGARWTINQWKGYCLRNVTKGRFSSINSNNSNTITEWRGSAQGNPITMIFDTGDRFAIYKVNHALDHPGSSTSDLLTGDTPSPVWLNQIREPVYFWSNTLNGSAGGIGSPYATIVSGLDFVNNGTTPMPGYTPYVYPHPLITGGAVASPPAPANLRVLSGP
jgi:hypothetical protein